MKDLTVSDGIDNTEELTKVIYLKDIKRLRLLSYSSINSIKKFLRENNIPVLGSSRKYILAFQLHRACLQINALELQKAYGSAWFQILQSEINLYTHYKTALLGTGAVPNNIPNPVSTKSVANKNIVEAKFLLDVEKLTAQ
ncbi:MAG TPA: hypothetical protein VK809_02615 [Bacteroidia bacterium]|jgi:hypothetical protein|nr:hypothetical protein [Bacteroidia bacterium]